MRTTIRLDDDVAAAAQRLSRQEHIGWSAAGGKCGEVVDCGYWYLMRPSGQIDGI